MSSPRRVQTGMEPCLEPLLGGGERPLAATPGSVGQGVWPVGVVAGDPGVDLTLGEEHLGHDLGGGLAEQRQPEGYQSACEACPGLGPDAVG
jgi:hypothetical protein